MTIVNRKRDATSVPQHPGKILKVCHPLYLVEIEKDRAQWFNIALPVDLSKRQL
jgi:hypothetical protein